MSKVTKSSGCVFNDLNVNTPTPCDELKPWKFMHEGPERIWIEQDDCPYFYEESELAEAGSPVTEYIRADLCQRRTFPPCDGLETVGWLWEYAQYRTDERGYYGYETVITENNPKDHVSPAEKLRNIRELVTRQNAEEVIAAKDARIAELEEHFAEMTRSCLAERDRNKALEADNKRLREALKNLVERFSYYADLARDGVHNIEDWAYTEGSSDIAEARAALGEVKT